MFLFYIKNEKEEKNERKKKILEMIVYTLPSHFFEEYDIELTLKGIRRRKRRKIMKRRMKRMRMRKRMLMKQRLRVSFVYPFKLF